MLHSTIRLRPAIAMIELIFALVIMGITLMSAPMILNQSIQSTTTGMQQESVAATATQISLLMTYPWDESNTAGTVILTTQSPITALQIAQRQTSINNANLGRKYALAAPFLAATAIASEEATIDQFDDVDDFDGANSALNLYAGEAAAFTNNEGDYMDTQVNIATTVHYSSETNGGAGAVTNYAADPIVFNNPFQNDRGIAVLNSTNIKLINVTLTSTRNGVQEVSNKSVSLSAFVCNIGQTPPNPIIRVN